MAAKGWFDPLLVGSDWFPADKNAWFDEALVVDIASGGVNGTATPSGVSGAYAVGAATLSGTATISATGVSGTTALGTVTASGGASVNGAASPNGVAGTYSVGPPTASGAATSLPSGVAGTTAVGTATLSASANKAVTGVSGTASVGTATASAAANTTATGAAGAYSVGTTTTTGAANATPSGVSGTWSVGTAVASGQSVVNGNATPAGLSVTGSVGSLAGSGTATITVSGVQAAGSVHPMREMVWASTYAVPDYSSNSIIRADAIFGVAGVSGVLSVGSVDAHTEFVISSTDVARLYQIYLLHGLGSSPLVVSSTGRSAGGLVQTVSGTGPVTIATTKQAEVSADVSTMIRELAALHGIGEQLVVTSTSRTAGSIQQSIVSSGASTTVTRL